MKKTRLNTQKAFKYYFLGLNSKEIAKLLNCSYRTVQNYMSLENWKEKRKNLKIK
jgi:DNA-directed RNA polymerase specialized sigma24 family protein